ncbi:hypothetical protein [Streptomyces sp. NPDC090025]|uniref:hypothetical protein n=1 Tax=Streptomyces sp. NPDC090025 TaxID=3365922 RepID=UPI003836B54F
MVTDGDTGQVRYCSGPDGEAIPRVKRLRHPVPALRSGDVDFLTDFAMDPMGRWRHVDSDKGNRIVRYVIDVETGVLTPTGRESPQPALDMVVLRGPRPAV